MFGDFYRSQGVKEVYEKGVVSNFHIQSIIFRASARLDLMSFVDVIQSSYISYLSNI